jgi:hypothetical protein
MCCTPVAQSTSSSSPSSDGFYNASFAKMASSALNSMAATNVVLLGGSRICNGTSASIQLSNKVIVSILFSDMICLDLGSLWRKTFQCG